MWTSLLPYVLVPAVGILIVYAWRTSAQSSSLARGVYIGGAVLIGLMVLRQVLTIVENARLYNRLQRTHRQVEHKNDQLVQSQRIAPAEGVFRGVGAKQPGGDRDHGS